MNWKRSSVLLLLFGSGVAFAQQTCQAVYQNAVRNIDLNTRQTVQASDLFDQHCETNGSTKSSSLSVGLEATVKQIPVKFSLGSGSASEKLQTFCKTFASTNFERSDSYSFQSNVVTESLRLLNQCLEIEKSGVRASHVVNGQTSVTVRFDFETDKQQVMLRSVTYDEKAATCTTTGINGSPTVVNSKLRQVLLQRSFAIVCRRTPTQLTNGTLVYKPLELSVDTNFGPYTVSLQGDQVYAYALASRNQAMVNSLKQEKSQLTANVATLKAQQAQTAAALDQANSRIAGVVVDAYTVVQGQGATVACPQDGGNINTYMSQICANRRFGGFRLIANGSGRRCGYSTYIFTCITI